jgi:hypothetical protein
MRTYNRAEERRLINQAWDRDHLKLYWWDYDHGFDRDELRPFWEPDDTDSWNSYYNDIDINDVRKGKLMMLLIKLKLRSPLDVIGLLYW